MNTSEAVRTSSSWFMLSLCIYGSRLSWLVHGHGACICIQYAHIYALVALVGHA